MFSTWIFYVFFEALMFEVGMLYRVLLILFFSLTCLRICLDVDSRAEKLHDERLFFLSCRKKIQHKHQTKTALLFKEGHYSVVPKRGMTVVWK